jgi:hypothetical protein
MEGKVGIMHGLLLRFCNDLYQERPGQTSKGPNEVEYSKKLIPNKPIYVTRELMLMGNGIQC